MSRDTDETVSWYSNMFVHKKTELSVCLWNSLNTAI